MILIPPSSKTMRLWQLRPQFVNLINYIIVEDMMLMVDIKSTYLHHQDTFLHHQERKNLCKTRSKKFFKLPILIAPSSTNDSTKIIHFGSKFLSIIYGQKFPRI